MVAFVKGVPATGCKLLADLEELNILKVADAQRGGDCIYLKTF